MRKSNWIMSPGRGEKNKCLKPPPSWKVMIKKNTWICVPDGEEKFKKVWKAGVDGNKHRDSNSSHMGNWLIDWKPQPTPPLLIFGNFNTLGNSHRPTRITCTMLNWYCVFRRDCLDLFGFFQMCKEMTSFCLFCFREGVYFLQIHENLTDWAPIAPKSANKFLQALPFLMMFGMLSKVPVPPLEHAPKLEHSHANTSDIPLASHHCLANRDSQNDPIVMPVSVKE